MELRDVGLSGLRVAPLAFGGNVFGWTASETQSFRLLDAFVDAGLNLIDTADVYSRWVPGHQGGESESVIGKWIKKSGKRDRIVLATKVGFEMSPGKKGLAPARIVEAVDASLKRLQTDCIDLYQAHTDDTEVPLEDSLGAFDDLIRKGKVRAIGASNYSAERLELALQTSERLGLARYESLQPLYNLYDRVPFEAALEGLCLARGLAVLNYYALASGFLTGKYRVDADLAQSPRGQGAKKYLNPRGLRILGALDEAALELGATCAQVALAWLLQRKSVTAPIASATSLEQFEDMLAAMRLRLPADTVTRLELASRGTD